MGNVQILVADDEPHILTLLRITLEKEGFDVTSATDGDSALQRFHEIHPAIVILDGTMPGRDGYAVARDIRASEPDPRPYVMMLTAGAQDADRQRALDAGVDEFLTKPFSPSGLRARVREIIATE